MLSYTEKTGEKYSCFFELLVNENIKNDDINTFEYDSFDKLLQDGYIYIDDEGFIRIKNKVQLLILRDVYDNDVISYWHLTSKCRNEVDTLVRRGILKFDSSLFSLPEQRYLNFNLNKKEFTNSLDLRNKYAHGTQAQGGESTHYENYVIFLKLFIFIKINDELCLLDSLKSK